MARQGMEGAEVLNAFAYTGGFTVTALQGGARSVLSIDSSAEALEMARAERGPQRTIGGSLPVGGGGRLR